MSPRILMLGWEFPPYISGGLGTACQGIVHALGRLGAETVFVLPSATGPSVITPVPRKDRAEAQGVPTWRVPAELPNPYGVYWPEPRVGALWRTGPGPVLQEPGLGGMRDGSVRVLGASAEGGYGGNLHEKIRHYASRCAEIAEDLSFDVVHAHDWMTFPAGMAIARSAGRPLVVHVHATEFDRSGEHVCQPTYDIEREGMHAADRVIAVSRYTKDVITQRFGVDEGKVEVVYNGVDPPRAPPPERVGGKTILFLGRITWQKGPEYFVRAAARVAERVSDARFLVAGWGDLGPAMVEQACWLGLGSKMRFAGFLNGRDVERAYRAADVFVMPSVSEPFGLTALEAASNGLAVVLSKNSGVSEVLRRGSLAVDFWDVDRMATLIVALLRRPQLRAILREHAREELRSLTWDAAAARCVDVYKGAIAGRYAAA